MKKVLPGILILAVLFSAITVLAAGTQPDPLITQKYAENGYRFALRDFINIGVSDSTANARVAAVEELIGFVFSPGFKEEAFTINDEITLYPGSSFILNSGSASIIYTKGSVLNVSTGNTVLSGTPLILNQRYFCAENTRATVIASATSAGYADGYYKYTQSLITKFVERLYTEVLGRTYDEYGLQSWVQAIVSGSISAADVAYGFVFSRELTNRNLSNADFVEMLYRAILGRVSDPSGKAAWINVLNTGESRQVVFNGFAYSVEYDEMCREYGLIPSENSTVPEGIRVFVTRLYEECLGRQPDLQGRNSWMRILHNRTSTGSQVAYGFVFSAEINNKNLSDSDFIEMLYRTMLGRESDPSGRADWLARLGEGLSRQQAFEGFAHSIEFTRICNMLGVLR